MRLWEYELLADRSREYAIKLLNEYGRLGWELVSVSDRGDSVDIWLKRPLQPSAGSKELP